MRKKTYKILYVLLIIYYIINNFKIFAEYTLPFEIESESAYFADALTDKVIFSKNPHKKIVPASLAKIVMALVAYDKVKNWQKVVTVPSFLFDEFINMNVSSVGIKCGEKIRLIDLLNAAIIASACEASKCIAYYVGNGSVNKFVDMMNKKVKSLGANDTCFTDVHGIDENQYTTAYDMYLIVKEAIKNLELLEMVSKITYSIPQTNKNPKTLIFTTNRMLLSGSEYFYKCVKGFKTGSLNNLLNFASYSQYKETGVIGIILGAPIHKDKRLPNTAFLETKEILKWIFSSFSSKTIKNANESINEVRVRVSSIKNYVNVAPNKDITIFLPNGLDIDDLETKFNLPECVNEEVKKGDKLGTVEFSLNGDVLIKADLFSMQDVSLSSVLRIFYKTINMKIIWVLGTIMSLGVINIVFVKVKKKVKAKRKKTIKY